VPFNDHDVILFSYFLTFNLAEEGGCFPKLEWHIEQRATVVLGLIIHIVYGAHKDVICTFQEMALLLFSGD
jgi:hypothetical protein